MIVENVAEGVYAGTFSAVDGNGLATNIDVVWEVGHAAFSKYAGDINFDF